jgi:hypothetical protein
MPSNDEVNAAFDAAQPDLHAMVKQFVPFMFEGQAEQALSSQDGRQRMVIIARKMLTAAEGVRAKAGPAKASSPR